MVRLKYKQRYVTNLYAILAVIFHKTSHNFWDWVLANNFLCCFIHIVASFNSTLMNTIGICVSRLEEGCMHGMPTQLALRRWPNVGPTSTLTLGQRGFVNWPNVGPTVARQRWPNVVPTSAQRWHTNVGPTLVQRYANGCLPTLPTLAQRRLRYWLFVRGTHRSPIGHRLNKQSSWVTSDLRHQCDRRQCNIHMSKDVTVLFRRCTDWSKHNVQNDNGLLLAGAKPLIWTNAGIYCQLDPCKQTSVKFNRNSYICIQENAFENVVWKMAIILSGPQWVHMNQVFMLVYSRSVTMPKTRPELIAASSIGTISAQSSSGKLWSEKKTTREHVLGRRWVDIGRAMSTQRRFDVGLMSPADVGPTSVRRQSQYF